MSTKRVSEMTDAEIRAMVAAVSDTAARHADARTCECGALIEEIDLGNSVTYWAHVKRMRMEYDHSAVPAKEEQ